VQKNREETGKRAIFPLRESQKGRFRGFGIAENADFVD
jgi:hypothetical protein